MLSFGVVIPTKTSMKYLPGHIESLAAWIDLAEQVVVVDSFSKDGTVDYLKKNLRHPQIKFVEHPPGLYASWNYGVSHITSEFCYISTVGDSITLAGIEHLAASASRLKCDVLVSRPDFVNETGQPCAGPEWPLDDLVKRLKLHEPVRLPSAVIVATALLHTGGALTGSCASDLFRSSILQKHPFPLDFGVAGDGAWSLQNAGRVNWAVTSEKVTTFRRHPPTASVREIKEGEIADRYAKTASKMVNDWLTNREASFPDQIIADMKKLLAVSVEYEQRRRQYNAFRKRQWPWSLNPAAWLARVRRNQLRRQAHGLMESICQASRRLLC